MSCHGCATQFGFLKREYKCCPCGFSYCKKCLRFKSLDPATNKEILICQNCNERGSSKMDPEEPIMITKALQKLESMEDPSRPPITVYSVPASEKRLAQLKRGLSEEDKHLADRLHSLRSHSHDGNKGRIDEEEIKARLARLKDEDPSLQSLSNNQGGPSQFNVKPETDTDLIAKYSAEAELDKQYQAGFTGAVADIELRLGKLRGDSSTSSNTPKTRAQGQELDIEEISEEEQIAQIIARCKAEVELEAKNEDATTSSIPVTVSMPCDSDEDDNDDDEDLDNLCRICDEKKATLKCEECDGDLFCNKCFKELHAELGEVHKPVVFKKN